jgi:hypothetical protein
MIRMTLFVTSAILLATAGLVQAGNEVEGRITQIDTENRTLTVQGIIFLTDERTDYDDGLRRFEDLREGQRVEVEFIYRDGRHIATEIELDD